MTISVYNTPFRKKQEFTPLTGNRVNMYACGVTVYDMSHIGHARSMIIFDVISRFIRSKGYDLTFVRNFTDVDDKIIARANELGTSYKEISERYIDEFQADMRTLKVQKADVEPKATEYMPQIIDMIRRLEEKGFAYRADDGSVYYSVTKFRGYGSLSGRRTEEMLAGARVDIGELKRDPLDFALWKRSKNGEPWWESPWSKGRPGWHIECSAMSTSILGPTIDIHGGGRDLVFPHHENEIAQSEGTYGVPFVRYWVHNGFVTIDGEKMSKSLGNFLTIRDLVKDVHPEVLRLLLISQHYRSPINFSRDSLQATTQAMVRFYEVLDRVNRCPATAPENRLTPLTGTFLEDFDQALSDDFNTPRAIALLHDLTTVLNRTLDDSPAVTAADRDGVKKAFGKASEVLGILEEEPVRFLESVRRSGMSATGLGASEIEDLIGQRAAARKARDFEKADGIRDLLLSKGIQLKDTPEGTVWETL